MPKIPCISEFVNLFFINAYQKIEKLNLKFCDIIIFQNFDIHDKLIFIRSNRLVIHSK